MTIEYRQTRDFTEEDLRRLFLSVGWYPKRLVTAMRNSTHVISAWDGDRLIGLLRALDDGATIAFLHYVLVDPKYQGRHIGYELMKRIMKNFTDLLHVKVIPSDPRTITFYERYGFRQYDNCPAMVRKNMQNKD